MQVTPGEFHRDLVARLTELGDPARAASERAYLKSDREFIGVTVPIGRRVVRDLLRQHGVGGRDDAVAAAAECWAHAGFDSRRAATEILMARRATLTPDDLPMLEAMIRDGETWALVDALASSVVGSIVSRHPEETGPVLDRWAADPTSFWLRRASMLALLEDLRAGAGDWDRFTRYADGMLDEREFFIRKAIGWVLRDCTRKRPEMVRAWVEPRLDRMSGVTRREAMKYL